MSEISGNNTVNNSSKIGYYASRESRKENIYRNEPHIHKQDALTGIRAEAHKYTNDILTYFPKGFRGSKNSDFYEFLSLGKIPYLIGSILLIGLYSGARGKYNSHSASAAGKVAKNMGAGVVLYGLGKLLSKKFIHKAIHASTGVDLDMKYMNIVQELPENGEQAGFKRIQYPGVFDSADFPRKDLISLDNELNQGDANLAHGDIYAYEDKIARKAGFKDTLNAPNQIMWPKIRELKVRTTALENVSQYIAAATGVALGAQNAFQKLDGNAFKLNKTNISQWFNRTKDKAKDFDFSKVTSAFKENLNKIKSIDLSLPNIKAKTKDIADSAKTSLMNCKDSFASDFQLIKNTQGFKNKAGIITDRLKPCKDIVVNKARQIKNSISKHKPGILYNVGSCIVNASKQLWQGTNRNAITKHYGKVLIIGTAVSAILSWLIPTFGFKSNPNTMKSKVDTKKEYEVC